MKKAAELRVITKQEAIKAFSPLSGRS